jgi:hypothetical protein
LIDAIEDEICPLLNFDYLSFLEKTVGKRVIATLQLCQIVTVTGDGITKLLIPMVRRRGAKHLGV